MHRWRGTASDFLAVHVFLDRRVGRRSIVMTCTGLARFRPGRGSARWFSADCSHRPRTQRDFSSVHAARSFSIRNTRSALANCAVAGQRTAVGHRLPEFDLGVARPGVVGALAIAGRRWPGPKAGPARRAYAASRFHPIRVEAGELPML